MSLFLGSLQANGGRGCARNLQVKYPNKPCRASAIGTQRRVDYELWWPAGALKQSGIWIAKGPVSLKGLFQWTVERGDIKALRRLENDPKALQGNGERASTQVGRDWQKPAEAD